MYVFDFFHVIFISQHSGHEFYKSVSETESVKMKRRSNKQRPMTRKYVFHSFSLLSSFFSNFSCYHGLKAQTQDSENARERERRARFSFFPVDRFAATNACLGYKSIQSRLKCSYSRTPVAHVCMCGSLIFVWSTSRCDRLTVSDYAARSSKLRFFVLYFSY